MEYGISGKVSIKYHNKGLALYHYFQAIDK